MEAVDAGDDAAWIASCALGLDYDDVVHARSARRATPRRRGRPSTAPASRSRRARPARERRARPLQGAAPVQHHRHRHGWADAHPVGDRGAEAAAAPRIATNEEIWCQLFSEPGAGPTSPGSPPAPCATATSGSSTARRSGRRSRTCPVGDARRAHRPRRAEAPRASRYFIVDMHAPGVEVRPLVQITGDAEFNEVFFTRRAHPRRRCGSDPMATAGGRDHHADERAGRALGRGLGRWRLSRRRARSTGSSPATARWPTRVAAAARRGLHRQPLIRLNNQRAADSAAAAPRPGPRARSPSCMQAEYNQRAPEARRRPRGPRRGGVGRRGAARTRAGSAAWPTTPRPPTVVRGFLRAQANTIEGGTSDVMRNILGERVLGLPKEPDPSRDVPWKDVPRNS